MTKAVAHAGFDLPDLDPIIAHEETEDGWRGLTEHGEIFEVRGRNGHKATPPDGNMLVMRGGKALGYRAIKQSGVKIDDYLERFNRAAELFRCNDLEGAAEQADLTVAIAPTVHARYNRAFINLSLGRWFQGFADYDYCEQGPPFQRRQCKAALIAGVKLWQGEKLEGKRLLALHAHGFGDTIMALRYVAELRDRGVDVVSMVPDELFDLAQQVGPTTANVDTADYFVPFLMLPHWCGASSPENVAPNFRLEVDHERGLAWRERLGLRDGKPRVGIAWSVGVQYEGDYPRPIPLADLVAALPGAELHSVQVQGVEEAMAHGVTTHELEDFADCAALMANMDAIVTVDTAAAHLAGAIEAPTTLLLSHWHSWRWLADWYPTMTLCCQELPGDWASALAQM